jgi:hypothetical protein
VRATLEELAREDPGMLDELTGRDWAIRYGRPVRLGGQPSRPATRLKQAGQDTHLLLTMLGRSHRPCGPDSDGLRRIFLQNFVIADGKVRPRAEEDGLPPASLRIISPCDLQARFAMRGDTRWAGYLIHVTETCDEDTVNLVTDVATTISTVKDHEAPALIRARRGLLPGEHLADGGLHHTRPPARRRGPADHHGRAPRPRQLLASAREHRLRPSRLHHRLRETPGDVPGRQDQRQLARHRARRPVADHRGEVRHPPVRSLPEPGLMHPVARGPDR